MYAQPMRSDVENNNKKNILQMKVNIILFTDIYLKTQRLTVYQQFKYFQSI